MRALAIVFAMVLMPFAAPVAVMAEEWSAPATEMPKPIKRVVKPKARKKTELVASLPAAPVPYIALKSTTVGAKLPPVAKSEPVTDVPVAGMESIVAEAPPPLPVPPKVVVKLTPALKPTHREINLKCDTVTVIDKKNSSRGIFYISLIPSETFPETGADFKVMSIDPDHRSIIRETLCFSFRCSATVNAAYYELIDQSQKKGGYVKISLNRTTGAFYGQKHWTQKHWTPSGLIGSGDKTIMNETGFCRPETAGNTVLF